MFIFKSGRLLERQLFEYHFRNGTRQACLKALKAYQNDDGGFGNGIVVISPAPASSGIGAEAAMFMLETSDSQTLEMAENLIRWITGNQNSEGTIYHPPAGADTYPIEPWWNKPDPERVLTLAGRTTKWGVGETAFFEKVRSWFRRTQMPDQMSFYTYPYFVYLKYCSKGEGRGLNLPGL